MPCRRWHNARWRLDAAAQMSRDGRPDIAFDAAPRCRGDAARWLLPGVKIVPSPWFFCKSFICKIRVLVTEADIVASQITEEEIYMGVVSSREK